MSDETKIRIDGIAFPPGSARGLRQTLEPSDNGELRRSVNGALVDLTRPETRKLRSSITVNDQAAPGLAHLWRGQLVSVDCAATLSQSVAPAASVVELIRPAVEAAAVQGFDADHAPVALTDLTAQTASFAAPVALVSFRPRLTMRITGRSQDFAETAAEVGWSLELEEA